MARQRLRKIVETTRAPGWLGDVVMLLADNAAAIAPLPEDNPEVPAMIYRH